MRGHFRMDDALVATRAMLAGPGEPPTAVFACSDVIALGVYRALAEHGLRVPDEVSVVGFDDSLAAAYATPGLTTVRRSWPEPGEAALDALFSGRPATRTEVPTALVVRSSTAAV
ncbi:substrate-binding domain-containing protein [Streptosporangium sp. NPDC050855]|uniref:substrate-binding domain-containing protein n=1 Tax=Streptosporangium sp. NPDC050855 TaxID=3366194 RepID=UPI0037BD6206